MKRTLLLALLVLLPLSLLAGALRLLPAAQAEAPVSAAALQTAEGVQTPITDHLAFRGHSGGLARGIAVSGGLAVATFGPVVATLDAAGPAPLLRQGQVVLAAEALAVALVNEVALVGTFGAGVQAVDVGEPAAPIITGAALPGANVFDVAVEGSLLLAATGDGLRLLDVANPGQPAALGEALTGRDVRAVVANGSLAYAVLADGALAIVDVTLPQAPALLGELDVGDNGGGVVLASGSLVYVTWSVCSGSCSARLTVVDVSVSTAPQPVAERALGPGRAGPLTVSGGYAYVTRNDLGGIHNAPGVDVLDVAAPSFPVPVQSIDPDGAYGAYRVWAGGPQALIAFGGAGLRRYTIADPTAPELTGALSGPARVRALQAWAGGWLVGAGDGVTRGELWRLDAAARTRWSLPTASLLEISGVAVDGAQAVVVGPAGGTGRLQAVDLTTPAAPQLQGILDMGVPLDVALDGTTAAVSLANGVQLVDLSQPLTPTAAALVVPGGAVDLADGLLIVAAGADGVRLLDVTDVGAPQLLGTLDLPGSTTDVVLSGTLAFVAAGADGLFVVDAADPGEPEIVGALQPPWPVPSLALNGAYLVVPAGAAGAHVIDIGDPRAPRVAAGYVDGRDVTHGAGQGDAILLGTPRNGVFLLQQRYPAGGRVAQANGLPWAGATITLAPGLTTVSQEDGRFLFTNLVSGTYTATAGAPGYVFSPPTRLLRVPPAATAVDFTILPPPQPFTVGVAGGTYVFTDTQGMTTTLVFPVEAVTQPTALIFTPTVAADTQGYLFAGHGFDLGPGAPAFSRPVSVTIGFTADDLGAILAEELVLWRWMNGEWEPAGASCLPPAATRGDGGRYAVAICGGGQFALFGPPRLLLLPGVLYKN